MTDYYWIGTTGDSWADGDKWSLSTGGELAAAYPGINDLAHFDAGGGAFNGTIPDMALGTGGIVIDATYWTVNITWLPANTALTIGSAGLVADLGTATNFWTYAGNIASNGNIAFSNTASSGTAGPAGNLYAQSSSIILNNPGTWTATPASWVAEKDFKVLTGDLTGGPTALIIYGDFWADNYCTLPTGSVLAFGSSGVVHHVHGGPYSMLVSVDTLECDNSGTSDTCEMQFSEGTYLVANNMLLRGNATHPLLLRSGTPGKSWNIQLNTSGTFDLLDIQDGQLTAYDSWTPPLVASNSIDSGNNHGWFLPPGAWLGTTDSNWSTAANWAGAAVPGPGTDVVFDFFGSHGGAVDCVIDVPVSVNSITIWRGYSGHNITQNANVETGSFLQAIGSWTNNGEQLMTIQDMDLQVQSNWFQCGPTFGGTGQLRVDGKFRVLASETTPDVFNSSFPLITGQQQFYVFVQ